MPRCGPPSSGARFDHASACRDARCVKITENTWRPDPRNASCHVARVLLAEQFDRTLRLVDDREPPEVQLLRRAPELVDQHRLILSDRADELRRPRHRDPRVRLADRLDELLTQLRRAEHPRAVRVLMPADEDELVLRRAVRRGLRLLVEPVLALRRRLDEDARARQVRDRVHDAERLRAVLRVIRGLRERQVREGEATAGVELLRRVDADLRVRPAGHDAAGLLPEVHDLRAARRIVEPAHRRLHPVRQVLPHRQAHREQRLRRVQAVRAQQDLPAARRRRPLQELADDPRRPAELAGLDEHDADREALGLLPFDRLVELLLPRPPPALERDHLVAAFGDDLQRGASELVLRYVTEALEDSRVHLGHSRRRLWPGLRLRERRRTGLLPRRGRGQARTSRPDCPIPSGVHEVQMSSEDQSAISRRPSRTPRSSR
jgi:hypothetical protein